jgi:hypothetical protein
MSGSFGRKVTPILTASDNSQYEELFLFSLFIVGSQAA